MQNNLNNFSNIENYSLQKWSNLIFEWSQNVIQSTSDDVRLETDGLKLDDSQIIKATQTIVNRHLEIDDNPIEKRIRAVELKGILVAFGKLAWEQHEKIRIFSKEYDNSYSARFYKWGREHSTLVKIIVVLSLGILSIPYQKGYALQTRMDLLVEKEKNFSQYSSKLGEQISEILKPHNNNDKGDQTNRNNKINENTTTDRTKTDARNNEDNSKLNAEYLRQQELGNEEELLQYILNLSKAEHHQAEKNKAANKNPIHNDENVNMNLKPGEKPVFVANMLQLINLKMNTVKLYEAPIVTGGIRRTLPKMGEVDLSALKKWYGKIDNLITEKESRGNGKFYIKNQFIQAVDSFQTKKSHDKLNLTEGLAVTKIYKYINDYLVKKEEFVKQQINRVQDNRLKVRLQEEFEEEVKQILFDRLGLSYLNCSDRIILDAKNVYYEVMAKNPDYFTKDQFENLVLLVLLAHRRQLFSDVAEIYLQGMDVHAAATHRYLEAHFRKKFGLGTTELAGGSNYDTCCKKNVPLRNLKTDAYIFEDGSESRDAYAGTIIYQTTLEAVENRFNFQYTEEHIVESLQEFFESQRKAGGKGSELLLGWFKERYNVKDEELIDNKGWKTDAIYVVLRDMNVLKTGLL